jgi:hypothetical protein
VAVINQLTKGDPKKHLFRVGLVFLILACLGLILTFSTPWFENEVEGDSESYYYADFGEDFEEEAGSRFDEYFHWSANVTIIGYIFIIILSGLCIFEVKKGKFSQFIFTRFLKNYTENGQTNITSFFIIVIVILMIIPVFLVIAGGVRFIGVTNMLQMERDSVKVLNEEIPSETFGSTAGYITLIFGLIILGYCIYILYKEFSKIVEFNKLTIQKASFIKKLKIIGLLFVVLAIVGMITIPTFHFMSIDRYYVRDNVQEESNTIYFHDYFINLWARSGYGDDPDDAIENIDRDIGLIFWSLAIILIISLLLLFGILLYSFDKLPRFGNFLLFIGCFSLVFCLIIFVGYTFIINDINQLEEANDKENEEYFGDSSYFQLEENAKIGNNFGPLIAGVAILIIGLFYTNSVWPIAIPIIFSKTTYEPTEASRLGRKTIAKPGAHKIMIIIIIILAMLIAISGGYLALTIPETDKITIDEPTIVDYHDIEPENEEYTFNGYSNENSEYPVDFDLNQTTFVCRLQMALEWMDESDETRRHENEPDEFSLRLIFPTGYQYETPIISNEKGTGYGIIEYDTNLIDPPIGWEEDENFNNYWEIQVICGTCGDHEAQNFGLLKFDDLGNSWYLTVRMQCYVYPEETE